MKKEHQAKVKQKRVEWPEKICQDIELGNCRPPVIRSLSLKNYILPCLMSSILKTIVLIFWFFSDFGYFRWEGNLVAVAPFGSEAEVFALFLKNLFVFSRILGGHPHMRRI